MRIVISFCICLLVFSFTKVHAQQDPDVHPATTRSAVEELDRCNNLRDFAINSSNYQAAYDSARNYAVLCSMPECLGGFGLALNANSLRDTSVLRFVEFRDWLKAVLYLREDTSWYCADVAAILETVGSYFEGRSIYSEGVASIASYVLNHGRCPRQQEFFSKRLQVANGELYKKWKDTVTDSVQTPFNPHVPTLVDLGLEWIDHSTQGVEDRAQRASELLTELQLLSNPVGSMVTARFHLAGDGLVSYQLYDLLGNLVQTNYLGQVYGAGTHDLEVDGSKLASGVYFLRLSAHNSNTKTIQLRKGQ